MRPLLDVSVLIALLDRDHAMHAPATRWLTDDAGAGWASCPITQSGCVRVMAHPSSVPRAAVRGAEKRHLFAL